MQTEQNDKPFPTHYIFNQFRDFFFPEFDVYKFGRNLFELNVVGNAFSFANINGRLWLTFMSLCGFYVCSVKFNDLLRRKDSKEICFFRLVLELYVTLRGIKSIANVHSIVDHLLIKG